MATNYTTAWSVTSDTTIQNVTFDHKRGIVPMEHLIKDYYRQTSEADLSHLSDILRLHDLSKDPPAGDIKSFQLRVEKKLSKPRSTSPCL